MNSIQQVYTLNEQQCAEVNLAAEYILLFAEHDNRAKVAKYGEYLARGWHDVIVNTNGIAALFQSGAIDRKTYQDVPDDIWFAFERAVALIVFNRMGE